MNGQLAVAECWVSLRSPADVQDAAQAWLRSETARYSASDVDIACRAIAGLRDSRSQIGPVPLDEVFRYLGEHFHDLRHAQRDD
ncbi:hypothetical protein [Amnimonas aquatica]|uniref:Uncharacterized protein n=1 Tax=Amnimonas aquatica TaxID=2094561 RepID=A0A2P6AQ94_9GAMM|nr:hypothetical protein [Amnimonas aquatica]PQA28405.1 hypothetical protein C5O18_09845 [Amnimonas aquatica]